MERSVLLLGEVVLEAVVVALEALALVPVMMPPFLLGRENPGLVSKAPQDMLKDCPAACVLEKRRDEDK